MPDESAVTRPERDEWIAAVVPAEVKRAFRVLCATEGKTMSTKLLELIEAELEAQN